MSSYDRVEGQISANLNNYRLHSDLAISSTWCSLGGLRLHLLRHNWCDVYFLDYYWSNHLFLLLFGSNYWNNWLFHYWFFLKNTWSHLLLSSVISSNVVSYEIRDKRQSKHVGPYWFKKMSPLLLVSSPEFPQGWAAKEMSHFIIKEIKKNSDIVWLTETWWDKLSHNATNHLFFRVHLSFYFQLCLGCLLLLWAKEYLIWCLLRAHWSLCHLNFEPCKNIQFLILRVFTFSL